MDIKRILTELKAERARLDAAISAIEGINRTGARRGRPAGSRRRSRRRMSAVARKRISLVRTTPAFRRWPRRDFQLARVMETLPEGPKA